MEILKEIIIAVGGGTVVLIGICTIFKNLFVRLFEKSIDATFDKKIEKYKNTLARTTTAYEMLLNKEFSFYEKIDTLFAELIVLAHDLVDTANPNSMLKVNNKKEEYKNKFMKFLELIIKMKNEVLVYQFYIPNEIFDDCSNLVGVMQDSAKYFDIVANIIFEKSKEEIDVEKLEETRNILLAKLAMSQVTIKNRLDKLATNE